VGDSGYGEAGDHPAAAAAVDPNAVYALGRSSSESDRLYRQADELRPESEALVERAGLGAVIARSTSAAGRVASSSSSPSGSHLAGWWSGWMPTRRLSQWRRSSPPAGGWITSSWFSFDLVHARTLLINLPEPLEALTEMVRLARPGGWVVGIEPDVESALCYPPLSAFDRLCELFEAAFSRNGADPHFGRRMADLYRRAGLEDLTVEASAVLYPPGHSRRTLRADLVQSLRPHILEMGLADEGELNELDAAARTYFDDPDTVVMPGLMFLAWGRKPTRA
jgi:SAM-dependent methyltransferase